MRRARRALFLDRDGVINVDKGYVGRKEDFEFIDGIFDVAKYAHSLGYLLVIVTNQAGIARGLYTEDQFMKLMDWVTSKFEERGVSIAGVYFCPYHPQGRIEAYRRESFDRKPSPGMFFRASKELGIDLSQSIMIGDKSSDLIAAMRAGIPSRILISTYSAIDASKYFAVVFDRLRSISGEEAVHSPV